MGLGRGKYRRQCASQCQGGQIFHLANFSSGGWMASGKSFAWPHRKNSAVDVTLRRLNRRGLPAGRSRDSNRVRQGPERRSPGGGRGFWEGLRGASTRKLGADRARTDRTVRRKVPGSQAERQNGLNWRKFQAHRHTDFAIQAHNPGQ
jgi:hypothetical protein